MSGDCKHRICSLEAVDTELYVPSHLLGVRFVKKKKKDLCLRLNLLTTAILIFVKYHFHQDTLLYKRELLPEE